MKKFGLMFLCLAMLVVMTACTSTPMPTPSASPTALMPVATPPVMGSPEANPSDDAQTTAAMTGPESTALSQKANTAAAQISEVGSCVTAIIGDTCVAGVTFDPQYKGALTDRIRDMVASRIQSVAPQVARVAVTTDPEIAAQINDVATQISQTDALGALTDDLDALVGRIQ
jgi:YhcN/YlaJ family sporulation lipoprotein